MRIVGGVFPLLLLLVALPSTAAAAELLGTVVAVSGTEVRIRVDGDLLPAVGDPVVISFTLPGGTSLRVGTWKVIRIEADAVVAAQIEATGIPNVEQTAVISSTNPGRRAPAAATAAPGGGAPGGAAPGAAAPGPTTPLPPTIDITRQQFPSGRLARGDGHTEHTPGRFVVSSSADLTTWYALGIHAVPDYRAAARLRVAPGLGAQSVVGIQFTAEASADPSPGDLFFGKGPSGLLLAHWESGRWADIAVAAGVGAPPTGNPDLFEVTARGGRYEFRLNGQLVATWIRGAPRREWAIVLVERGSRAEMRDWRVEILTRP